MTKLSNYLLSWLLWTWGGATYFMLEVVYKTLTNHTSAISWTMLLLAFILCIPIERFGCELPWEMPLLLQALICATAVVASELIAGIVLNVWLGLGVWDYSSLPGNFMGQICPQFSVVWFALCCAFIPAFDWMRYCIKGGERPHYTLVSTRV